MNAMGGEMTSLESSFEKLAQTRANQPVNLETPEATCHVDPCGAKMCLKQVP